MIQFDTEIRFLVYLKMKDIDSRETSTAFGLVGLARVFSVRRVLSVSNTVFFRSFYFIM